MKFIAAQKHSLYRCRAVAAVACEYASHLDYSTLYRGRPCGNELDLPRSVLSAASPDSVQERHELLEVYLICLKNNVPQEVACDRYWSCRLTCKCYIETLECSAWDC